ncbi:MAG TPA: addiction module antidote protein [Steroidobacteraceae bacterium]|nr:addiction module antidote protein [Steroidobacteraceae bacterium]
MKKTPASRTSSPPFAPAELASIARELDGLLERAADAEVLDALRALARRAGGVGRLAAATGLNRTFLYKVLSPAGNPEMRTVATVLRAFGLRLAIRPQPAPRAAGAAGRRRRPR